MPTYVFACVANAGRSQMAAAFFNHLVAPESAQAVSAGTSPASAVHPEVLEAMKELGIDLSDARPRKLTTEVAEKATLLVTMGCGEESPNVPGLRTDDWPVANPKGRPLEEVRVIREEIRRRVEKLIAEEGLPVKS
ncbi:hypothetical protein WJX81_002403 [Elliptochloris bilobata]|uniref:Phosphotyrosine protein phosphatase I domain-containing protein n=1 Tax=Elliptochloris bilobata TaxID=381761 RepID=A0AAW1RBP9_9CHLO